MQAHPASSGIPQDVEDLASHFKTLPPAKPVYRFVPSAFVAFNTHACPLKVRLDYPADKSTMMGGFIEESPECPRRQSTANRHKERGIFLENALVESLGDRVIRCDSKENEKYPLSHYMMHFSNQPNTGGGTRKQASGTSGGHDDLLLFQLKLEFPDSLVDKIFSKVPEEIRAETRARMMFRPMFPDLIKLRRVLNESTNTQEIEVTAMDIKSSSHMKGGHQLQVATYHHVIEAMLQEQCEGQGWSFRMNPKGEVWIPKRVKASEVVTYEFETFSISNINPFLDSFFATVIPSVVCYDPQDRDAKYEGIEWTLNESCVMCPHHLDCKARAVKDGLTQLLPGIQRKDWAWLPKKLADLKGNAEHYNMKHRLRALTRSGSVTAAFKQQLPIFRLQDGAVSLRLPQDQSVAYIACTAVIDPFDGVFVYGSMAWLQKEETAVPQPGDSGATSSAEFVSQLQSLVESIMANRTQFIKFLVWNEPQKRALVKVCSENDFPYLLEETFDKAHPHSAYVGKPKTSDDGLHRAINNVVCMYDTIQDVVVLPVAGQPSMQECFARLCDPMLCTKAEHTASGQAGGVFHSMYPYVLPTGTSVDDLFMETKEEVRQRYSQTFLWGMMLMLRNIRNEARDIGTGVFKGHATAMKDCRVLQKPTPSIPAVETHAGILDLLDRAIVFDACAALNDRALGRQRRFVLKCTPDSIKMDHNDPSTQALRFTLLNLDHASEISVQSRLPANGTLRCTSCEVQGEPKELAIRQLRGGKVEGSPVGTFTATEGSNYFMCRGCKNASFKKPNEWLPLDHHPLFGAPFSSMGAWVLQKEGSEVEVDDVQWYKKMQMHIKLPPGSGTMFVDVADVNASAGTVCLLRRSGGIIPQPGQVYYLTQRSVNFNVNKALQAIRSIRAYPAQEQENPMLNLALGKPVDTNALLPMVLDPHIETDFSQPSLHFFAHTLREQLTVLWGPPGTGKTQTLTESILEWSKAAPNVRILVVAMTHKAIGELVSRRTEVVAAQSKQKASSGSAAKSVPSDFSFVHIQEGSKGVTRSQGAGADSEEGGEGEEDARSAKAPARGGKRPPIIPADPDQGCAVYCTIWEAYKQWLKPPMDFGKDTPPLRPQQLFDILVIDEASQMPFAFSMVPSCLMKKNCRVVLSGDLLQLPPIFHPFKDATVEEKPFVASAIQAVLTNKEGQKAKHPFDILEGQWNNLCQLTISYRSSPPIVDFVAGLYPQGLGAKWKEKYNVSPTTEGYGVNIAPANKKMLEAPLCTVSGVQGAQEATMITNIVAQLGAAYKGQGKKVMVVTPHRRQRDEIKAELRWVDTTNFSEITVDTAEKMQGSQAHFVLFALAAVNSASSFIFDVYRLNVAFSRAQQQVILVASDQTLAPPSTCLDTAEGRLAFSHLTDFVTRSSKIAGKSLNFKK